MRRVVVLDDYQGVAGNFADWAGVAERFEIDAVRDHLEGEALLERLRGAEIVMAMRERTALGAAVLAQLPDLRLIVTAGMVNASIDLDAAALLGITVTGTGSHSDTTVPELTIGMMIALGRQFVAEHESIRQGGWQHTIGIDLAGATLGIVGLGRLGSAVAALGSAFGMRVIASSPTLTPERAAAAGATAVDLPTLLGESDFVSLHARLTPTTTRMIGAAELTLMRPGAFLINTSRGPLIDEEALVAALRNGTIAGAGLDVFDREPLPAEHPLRSAPRTLLLPHLGYVTRENYRAIFTDVVDGILAYDKGSPVRVLAR